MTESTSLKKTLSHQDFLRSFTVGDMVETDRDVISVQPDSTAEYVLAVLNKTNVLSVAVMNEEKHEYLGMVNLYDICSAIVFHPVFDVYESEEKLAKLDETAFNKAQKHGVFEKPIREFLGNSDESKTLWVYDAADHLRDLLDVFAMGVHRVLVRVEGKEIGEKREENEDGVHVRVLSQTDVVRFLHTNAREEMLWATMQRSLKDLGFLGRGNKNDVEEDEGKKQQKRKNRVVILSENSSALTGFQKLTRYEVSGLAVVDRKGAIVGSLSLSDLRGITKETFKHVLLPVLDFLRVTKGKVAEPVVCAEDETLYDVISRILQSKVHRCFIVDESKVPVGVVTLTDIICLFSPYASEPK